MTEHRINHNGTIYVLEGSSDRVESIYRSIGTGYFVNVIETHKGREEYCNKFGSPWFATKQQAIEAIRSN